MKACGNGDLCFPSALVIELHQQQALQRVIGRVAAAGDGESRGHLKTLTHISEVNPGGIMTSVWARQCCGEGVRALRHDGTWMGISRHFLLSHQLFPGAQEGSRWVLMGAVLGSWTRGRVRLPPWSQNYPWKCPKLSRKPCQMCVLEISDDYRYEPLTLFRRL